MTISDVENDGDELRITWEANFTPDFSKNHIHVYWDTYSADQVSDDAADRGVEQGEWVPTDEYPGVRHGGSRVDRRAGRFDDVVRHGGRP